MCGSGPIPGGVEILGTIRMASEELKKYKIAHHKVNRVRGQPRKCEHCGTEKAKDYDWASKTKNYNDPQDYIRLCVSCHLKFDGRGLQLTEMYRSGKIVRKCACGNSFKARSSGHKFCSPKCYKKSKNDSRRAIYVPITLGRTVTCFWCGCKKRFKQKKNWQKFCSFACQQKQLIQSRREKRV